MSFVFRLAKYRQWINRQKENLEAAIVDCRNNLDTAKQRLAECVLTYENLCCEAELQLKQGTTPDEIELQQSLMNHSRNTIDHERGVVQQAERQLEQLIEKWGVLYRNTEMLDKLFDRQFKSYTLDVQRKEQKQFDEWSLMKGGVQQ